MRFGAAALFTVDGGGVAGDDAGSFPVDFRPLAPEAQGKRLRKIVHGGSVRGPRNSTLEWEPQGDPAQSAGLTRQIRRHRCGMPAAAGADGGQWGLCGAASPPSNGIAAGANYGVIYNGMTPSTTNCAKPSQPSDSFSQIKPRRLFSGQTAIRAGRFILRFAVVLMIIFAASPAY